MKTLNTLHSLPKFFVAALFLLGSSWPVPAADEAASRRPTATAGMPTFEGHEINPNRLLAKMRPEVQAAALDAASDNPVIARVAKLVERVIPFPTIDSLVVIQLNDAGSLLMPADKESPSAAPDRTPHSVRQSERVKSRIRELMDTGLYEYVEPDTRQYRCATPSDAAFADGRLWGLRNTGQSNGRAGADVEAVAAWDQTTGSSSVIVAVIDSGIRYTHQDLAANMWVNPGEVPGNGIDDDRNGVIDDVYGLNAVNDTGNPMDDDGHGTHCAGTIGAVANNAGPAVGVAWNVKLMALKFLDASGSGFTSDAIQCIDYGIAKGAKIMNNSWGGGGRSNALSDAIERARQAGVLFVVAAGNESQDNDRIPSYPASYTHANILSVAALDRSDLVASFSNIGLTSVDLGAPGVQIFSTVSTNNSAYANYSGTSMAAPHVSGVAALVRAKFPSISLTDLRNRILNNTRPVASLNGKVATGGAVSANRALGAATGGISVNVSTRPSPLRVGQPGALLAALSRSGSPLSGATVTGTFQGQSLTFRDNGAAPDEVGGDGVYSASVTPAGPAGSPSLMLSASHPSATSFQGSFPIAVAAAAPANDNFAAAIAIASDVTRVTGSNVGATAETGEPPHVGTTPARNSVWWKWTPSSAQSATITTFGSSFDTHLAVYTGSALSSLTRVASNDDAGGTTQSSVTFNAVAGTTYMIAVEGRNSASGNVVLNVPLAGAQPSASPVFVQNPANQTAPLGGSATFSVVVNGSPTPTLYWRKDGTVLADGGRITGASTATLRITNVTSEDSGAYDCVATNTAGMATSTVAFLTVEAAAIRPPNDNFSARSPVASNTPVTGNTSRATKETGEPNHAGVAGGKSVWWSWTATTTGQVTIDTLGSAFDTVLAVYTGETVAGLSLIAENDNAESVRQSRVVFAASAGTTYHIAVDGYGSAAGDVRLLVSVGSPGSIFSSPDTNRAIPDLRTISSTVTVSGLPTSVSARTLLLSVNIAHTYRGDLVVTLISPQGRIYTLTNRAGGGADDFVLVDRPVADFSTSNPATLNPNGTWTLRVTDAAEEDVGTLIGWSLRYQASSPNPTPTPTPTPKPTPGPTPPPAGVTFSADDVPIDVADFATVRSTVNVTNQPARVAFSRIRLNLVLRHTYIGDLVVKLISPQRQSFIVRNRSGGDARDIVLVDWQPRTSFTGDPNGTWSLVIEDRAAEDTGTLESWSLVLPPAQAPRIWMMTESSTNVRASRIIVRGTASDDDGRITAIQFRRAGTDARWTSFAPRTAAGDWVRSVDLPRRGTYAFEFRAVDNSGLVSDPVVLTVVRD